ncbi:MAG: glutamine-hydrolyzing GMP synthase [Deltaproteobacteria bacterium RBG_16_49_23]|nr:MAG: glutamine-hydrolyzing GMP synthase [Deltaproteobacteria bacterium RBG_16_49_23]
MERSSIFDKILILDFGSQYTQLIARRVRECQIYSEIQPYHFPLESIQALSPKGIILSGGPSSVYESGAPRCDPQLFRMGIPILGICYGMQLIGDLLGGEVIHSEKREYGKARLIIDRGGRLFKGIGGKGSSLQVWMSHGDHIRRLPPGFHTVAHSSNTPFAVIEDHRRKIYGLQFHPEVVHTRRGIDLIRNFLFHICQCQHLWDMRSFLEETTGDLKKRIGSGRAICGLSGGVDSTVVALLLHRVIGDRLKCIFVNNGLLRRNEASQVVDLFSRHFNIPLIYVDAEEHFLKRLKGVTDPEEKRKKIGREFISVFEKEARKIGGVRYLAQGTLYPDVIESVSWKGPSATIKSHHNVGGLPEKMRLKLVEPLRELFKDEVRALGRELGLPSEVIKRQPFPGPGLAIRIIGEVNRERLEILRDADEIVMEEMGKHDLLDRVWQCFAVLLPIKTVGVMGDLRTYENVVALRIVESQDGMTADWVKLPYRILEQMANRIINEVKKVNRVVYDVSSKPPSTIEWE